MEDAEFLDRMRQKIEEAVRIPVEIVIDQGDKRRLEVDLAAPVAKVIFGADVLSHSGLARMFSQYAILSLKEKRHIDEDEFLRYLRRN